MAALLTFGVSAARPWRGVPFVLAAVAAVARLYVGVHWATDLVGGASLGVAIGAAAWLLVGGGYRRPGPWAHPPLRTAPVPPAGPRGSGS